MDVMDTLSAMARAMATRGKPLRTFDWEKAARLIVERKAKHAAAGLAGDWEWTGGDIYVNGDPITTSYTYLSSTWATPELELDGETIDCWRYESETPGCGADTKWPPEALAILKGATP